MKTIKLSCPIRGPLNVPERSKDGLAFTEEKRRIDCIQFLLKRRYPKSHFRVETDLLRFGSKGRNSFRTDLVVFDCPADDVKSLPIDEMKDHVRLIAEIKRDHKSAAEAEVMQV